MIVVQGDCAKDYTIQNVTTLQRGVRKNLKYKCHL